MDLNQIRGAITGAAITTGKAALSALYPRDFEYYVISLELTDFDGNTIDFFSFPIMPSQITKSENTKTSIYNTLGGTTVISSDAFVPQDLTISGDFGRSFKIMTGNIRTDLVSAKGVRFSNLSGSYSTEDLNSPFKRKVASFLSHVKSGYGCIKVLQSIINRANGHDNGKPFRLYFYNPALGESYLVVPTKNPLTLTQNESKNMIWGYTLNLMIVAPLDKISFGGVTPRSMGVVLAQSAVQGAVNTVAKSVAKYAKQATNSILDKMDPVTRTLVAPLRS